ncbi:MAG TPA: SBBP repeat-containing protein [Verrucomicrobiae bacterium]|jgi:hypothetical protein|nr:SBBP repeat-containing protein [Verrucomicrobiae bacterium]
MSLDTKGDVVITGQGCVFGPNYQWATSTYGTYWLSASGSVTADTNYPIIDIPASSAFAIANDLNDNVYVTGYSPGNALTNDIVTLKYTSTGNQVWLQRYTGLGYGAVGNAITVDGNGNVYVAGYEGVSGGGTEMVLIKYSPVGVQGQSNGNFILEAYGSPGENFDIQASANLQTWQDLGRVIADTNGFAQFADTNASNFNARFYFTSPQ